jgi:carboxypeptidase C (cathepsin A)
VKYRAETGMLPILKPDGTSRASIFYVAYTRLDVTDHAPRPVTFCFNGGPGSASVWCARSATGKDVSGRIATRAAVRIGG